MSMSMIVNDN